jgi:hypothetical protein
MSSRTRRPTLVRSWLHFHQKSREAGNAEFKNLINDWAADVVFWRFFFLLSSSNGDGLL